MKMVEAIICPERLEQVKEALAEVEVFRLTVSDVKGYASQQTQPGTEGLRFEQRLVRKLKLEIAVNEEFVEPTVEAIAKAGITADAGAEGDGKIFLLPLEDVVRIRTGERGGAAI